MQIYSLIPLRVFNGLDLTCMFDLDGVHNLYVVSKVLDVVYGIVLTFEGSVLGVQVL